MRDEHRRLERREPERIPTLVLDEVAEPERLLRDPWRLTRGDVTRILAVLGILLVLFALVSFLVWRRLRIRPLLVPVPHRTHAPQSPGAR